MAAADAILVLEAATLIAMGFVWCIHRWASPHFKERLYSFRHLFLDVHHHYE
jgi:hypothetical protein